MSEKCSEPLAILLTPTHRQKLEDLARQRGISMGGLIRSLVAAEWSRVTNRDATVTAGHTVSREATR